MNYFYKLKVDEDLCFCEAKTMHPDFLARAFVRTDREVTLGASYANYPGVYVLLGPVNESPRRVYIGQAKLRNSNSLGIVNRMYEANGHEQISDWKVGIMFLFDNKEYLSNLNRLCHLENLLWKVFKDDSSFKVVNINQPSDATVEEDEENVLKNFIKQCKQFLNLVGVHIGNVGIFSIPSQVVENTTSSGRIDADTASDISAAQISEGIYPPEEAGITTVFRHVQCEGRERTLQAQIYQSSQTEKWMLCKGSRLSPLTTATETIKRLRQQYARLIDSDTNCTLKEIPLDSKNQAALFVCGTESRQASEYWKETHYTSSRTAEVQSDNLFDFKDRQGRWDARGRLEQNGRNFTVLRGSKVIIDASGNRPDDYIIRLRQQHANKIISDIVQEDITFNSASAAANFVAFQSCSGPREWKNSSGVSLGKFLSTRQQSRE